jgi:hypothetical protein
MAIRDLLWSCPHCQRLGGLGQGRGGWEVCAGCGARFRRAGGASIEARLPDQTAPMVRDATEWAAMLPPLERTFGTGDCLAESAAELRLAVALQPIRSAGGFLGRVERFGPRQRGTLRLETDRLRFRGQQGDTLEWLLAQLTGVQASSSALQIKPRRRPLATFRFPDSSARYWEEAVRAALKAFHRERSGRDVVEFQPRIVLE